MGLNQGLDHTRVDQLSALLARNMYSVYDVPGLSPRSAAQTRVARGAADLHWHRGATHVHLGKDKGDEEAFDFVVRGRRGYERIHYALVCHNETLFKGNWG